MRTRGSAPLTATPFVFACALFACASSPPPRSTLPAPSTPEPLATEIVAEPTETPALVPDAPPVVALVRTAEGVELTLEGVGHEACLGTVCASLPRARFDLPRPREAVAPGTTWIPPLTIDGAVVDPIVVSLDTGVVLSALPTERRVSDLRAALFAPFAITRIVTAGSLHVHLGAPDEASLDRLEALLNAASAAAFARFGELAGPIAIAWAPSPDPSDARPILGARWTLLTRADLPVSAANLPSMLETLAASVAHPTDATADVPRWLRRGMGRYGAWLLAADLRRADASDALHVIARAYERHRAATEARPIAEGEDADGAALALFCADLMLRRSGRSIADALAPSPESFTTRLADAHPELARSLAAQVAFRGVIDLDACVRPFRLRVVALRTNQLGTAARTQLFEGATVEGLVVRRAPADVRLRVGDVLVRLGQVPILADEDVDLALVGTEPGHRIASTWSRGERLVRVSLPVPFASTTLGVRFVIEADEGALGAGFPFTVGPRASRGP